MQNQDVLKIIDGLCTRLQEAELGECDDEKDLVAEVGSVVEDFIDVELGEFGAVWMRGKDKGKIISVWAYGADFWPDIAVEVRGLPTVAITVRLARRDDDLAEVLASAVGSSVIHSVQYSYAVPFVLDRTNSDTRQHWFDGEIEERLWADHRVSLVVRQQ
ncbi:MAG: hypothetical protein QUS33_00265 [Dehalococcoidia bacterium]|nr:hypothetical protein [Dehalococcoidia bacterium]